MSEKRLLQKGNNNNTNIKLNIEDIAISKSVKLLGIIIDHKLNFEEHFSVPWKKGFLQLNTISLLQKYMGKREKEAKANSFIYCNFK